MNGELFHMAMVAAYGNHYITNTNEKVVFSCNFDYIGSIYFNKLRKGLFGKKNEIIATSVEDWYNYIKDKNCIKIELLLSETKKDNHILSAYANGVSGWYIICRFHEYSEIWVRNWGMDEDKDKTKWNINYYGEEVRVEEQKLSIEYLHDLKKKFDSILEKIGIFAIEIGFEGWKEYFDRGREALITEPGDEEKPFPKSYPLEAKQLMLAARNSWVFGGMGWWNDSPPYAAHELGRDEEFNALTKELYSTMMECIQTSVNYYC